MSLVLKYPKIKIKKSTDYENNACPQVGHFKTEEMSDVKMIIKKYEKKVY